MKSDRSFYDIVKTMAARELESDERIRLAMELIKDEIMEKPHLDLQKRVQFTKENPSWLDVITTLEIYVKSKFHLNPGWLKAMVDSIRNDPIHPGMMTTYLEAMQVPEKQETTVRWERKPTIGNNTTECNGNCGQCGVGKEEEKAIREYAERFNWQED